MNDEIEYELLVRCESPSSFDTSLHLNHFSQTMADRCLRERCIKSSAAHHPRYAPASRAIPGLLGPTLSSATNKPRNQHHKTPQDPINVAATSPVSDHTYLFYGFRLCTARCSIFSRDRHPIFWPGSEAPTPERSRFLVVMCMIASGSVGYTFRLNPPPRSPTTVVPDRGVGV